MCPDIRVLMHTFRYFAVPDATSSELIEVSAFSKKKISRSKKKSIELSFRDIYLFYLPEVEIAVLDICYTQVWLSK
jgi:hypothetical protein